MFPLGTFSLNALPVLMLATGFFRSRSLDVFHYFGAAKASQDGPQDGAMLEVVLGGVLERFWEGFGGVFGASWGVLGAPCCLLDPRLGAILGRLGAILSRLGRVLASQKLPKIAPRRLPRRGST